jgi:hypothetical protein
VGKETLFVRFIRNETPSGSNHDSTWAAKPMTIDGISVLLRLEVGLIPFPAPSLYNSLNQVTLPTMARM